jgi:membrane-associated phospholipid phosphatase
MRFGARTVLAAVALTLVGIPFGLLLLLVKGEWRPLLNVDNGASSDLHRYAVSNRWFVAAMEALSTVGYTSSWLLISAVVVGWLAWRRLPRLAVFVMVTVLISLLVNSVVKIAVNRARPVLPDPVAHSEGLSFPSGHAQAAIVGYAVLLLVFLPVLSHAWRYAAIAGAAVMVVAIGFSRVALGVHYVSDILGGYVLGAAWVAAMTAAFNVWRVERGKPAARPAEGLEPEYAERIAVHEPAERDPESAPALVTAHHRDR